MKNRVLSIVLVITMLAALVVIPAPILAQTTADSITAPTVATAAGCSMTGATFARTVNATTTATPYADSANTITVSWDWTWATAGGQQAFYLTNSDLLTSTGTAAATAVVAVGVDSDQSNRLVYCVGSSWTAVNKTRAANTAYDNTLVLNMSAHTYTWTFDGTTMVSNAAFLNNVDYINMFGLFDGWGNTARSSISNLTVTYDRHNVTVSETYKCGGVTIGSLSDSSSCCNSSYYTSQAPASITYNGANYDLNDSNATYVLSGDLSLEFEYTLNNPAQPAADALTISGYSEGAALFGDLTLPATVSGYSGSTVTWSASPSGIINTTSGRFTAPENTTTLTLTATVSYGGSTATKTFIYSAIGGGSSDPVDATGLIVHYDFSSDAASPSTVADSSGNGYDGTVINTNGTITVTNGWANFPSGADITAAIKLPNGVNSEVTGDFTVSMWIKENTSAYSSTQLPRYFDFGSTETTTTSGWGWNQQTVTVYTNCYNSFFARYATTGALTFQDRFNATTTEAYDTLTISEKPFNDTWGLLTVVYSKEGNNSYYTPKLYVNGNLVLTSTKTIYTRTLSDLGTLDNNSNGMWIGRTQWYNTTSAGTNPDFHGGLDDFRLYGRALSSAEITALYASTHPQREVDVTVKFVDTNGRAIAESISTAGRQYDEYSYDGAVSDTINVNGTNYYLDLASSTTSITLGASDNEISYVYVAGTITGAAGISATTYVNHLPTLPESVAAMVNNSANFTVQKAVTWEEIDISDCAAKGSFTVIGDIADSSATVTATIYVYDALLGSKKYTHADDVLIYDLDPDTEYKLTFVLGDNTDIPETVGEIGLHDDEDAFVSYAHAVTPASYASSLEGYSTGDTIELLFTSPSCYSTLHLPENAHYLTYPALYPVLGANGDVTIEYVLNSDNSVVVGECEAAAPLGSVFTLNSKYLSFLDGYTATTVVASSEGSFTSLDSHLTVDGFGQYIRLGCNYSASEVELTLSPNFAYDLSGGSYLTATANAFNGTDSATGAVMWLATYAEDGSLSAFNYVEIPLGAHMARAAEESIMIGYNEAAGEYAMAFLWEDLDNISPYDADFLDSRTAEIPHAKYSDEVLNLFPEENAPLDAIDAAQGYWQNLLPKSVIRSKVANTSNGTNGTSGFWDFAVYMTGNMEAYFLTGNEDYYDYAEEWGDATYWTGNISQVAPANWTSGYNQSYSTSSTAVLFGDWQCCFQTYLDMYLLDPDYTANDYNGNTVHRNDRANYVVGYQVSTDDDTYWWWLDALYMVMPVMAKMYLSTGDEIYLDKMYEYFLYAASLMYDGPDGCETTGANEPYTYLFYRDGSYNQSRVSNNATEKFAAASNVKNFWSRGESWCMAALSKVLEEAPPDWEHYGDLMLVYTRLLDAMVDCQIVDDDGYGFWSQSLLAPGYSVSSANPWGYETSGTALDTYALFWAINSGVVSDEKYVEAALRGFNYLTDIALQSNGLVGYVQPIGGEAGAAASATTTQNFAVGGYLLAMSEAYRFLHGNPRTLAYLDKKLWSAAAYKTASPYFYGKSAVTTADAPYTKNGETYISLGTIGNLLGYTVTATATSVTVTDEAMGRAITVDDAGSYTITAADGTAMSGSVAADVTVTLGEAEIFVPDTLVASAFAKHIFKKNGVIVMTHKITPFYDCDADVLDMLSDILTDGIKSADDR